MGPLEPESDYDPPVEPSRVRRGIAVGFVSLAVIAAIGIAYVRPPSVALRAPVKTLGAPSSYQLAGVAFVNASTGWFVATFDSGGFALLHTSDAGRTWSRQLTGVTDQRGVYMRFFDSTRGVFALVGNQPMTFWTSDGGRTWSSRPTINSSAYVQSLSFIDPRRGWLLARSTADPGQMQLLRTADGGTTWTNLGAPAATGDQPYRVQFDGDVGWLDTVSVKPHAYKSTDSGVSWTQVSLPAPAGGWPATGQFLVTAQPTHGAGVLATVVNFVPYVGRSGIGEQVIAFPPLTVRAFDGGLPVVYRYATFADAIPSSDLRKVETENKSGSYIQGQAPNQVQLGSLDGGLTWKVIGPPAGAGSIGYSDAQTWWWIGSGAWSRSSDGGASWSESRNIGVIQPLPGSLTVLDSKHAWYGAMAGTKAVLERTVDGGITWEMIGLPAIKS